MMALIWLCLLATCVGTALSTWRGINEAGKVRQYDVVGLCSGVFVLSVAGAATAATMLLKTVLP